MDRAGAELDNILLNDDDSDCKIVDRPESGLDSCHDRSLNQPAEAHKLVHVCQPMTNIILRRLMACREHCPHI